MVWSEVAEAVTEQEQEQEQEQAPVRERALEQQARELMALAKPSLAPRLFDNRYHRIP